MKLDKTFANEIRKLNGDGERVAKFALLKLICEANSELSTPTIRDTFNTVVKKYGRAIVGLCVAATIEERNDRLSERACKWAREVLKLWTNRTPSGADMAVIADGLHPTRIEEYAADLIKFTTEKT